MEITSKPHKVIHLTTVHPWWDNRIYEKMVKHLAILGHQVIYIAQPNDITPRDKGGVTFLPLTNKSGLLGKVLRNIQALILCLKHPGYIIHFHDPEIIFIALLLRLTGRPIVYDVHEDNLLSIQHKDYMPSWMKALIRPVVFAMEFLAAKFFHLVLAEKIYLKRFPRGRLVLNYPHFYEEDQLPDFQRQNDGPIRCIYTGNISESRGALNHVNLLKFSDNLEVHLVGRCSNILREKLGSIAGKNAERLHIFATEDGIPFPKIREYYLKGGWDIGLAIFPYSPHYYEKELTKFFEYMYYGIPILSSNFPVWDNLVKINSVGFTVPEYVGKEDFDKVLNSINLVNRKHLNECAVNNYSWSTQLQNLIEIYDSIQI